MDLEWMEKTLERLKNEVDTILDNMEDRYGPKELPNGRVVNAIISSKEDQLKAATAVMEKIPKMLQALDELRAKEEAKVEARGKAEISSQAEKWLQNRK